MLPSFSSCMRIQITVRSSLSRPLLQQSMIIARSYSCTPPLKYLKNEIEKNLSPEVLKMHEDAVAKKEDTYTDPETGLQVFTRLIHLRNKECCGSYCRHCPYNHCNVANRTNITFGVPKTKVKRPAEAPKEAKAPSSKSGVYTKGGDKGTSTLFTGERRRKTDVVFEALGATDELSSHVGLARSFIKQNKDLTEQFSELLKTLEDIQQQLMNVGTVVATPAAGKDVVTCPLIKLIDGYKFPEKTAELEKAIDAMDSRLPLMRLFILPGGGTLASAQLHVCRTTCRRAERRLIEVREQHGEEYTEHLKESLVYVNRLSDFFFVAARSVAEEDIARAYDN